MPELTDKTAFITGAASGIGEAITRRFAAAGARVWAADRAAEPLAKLVAEIRAKGGRIEGVELDVADFAACRKVADNFHRAEPRGLDVLVNNAGIGAVGTVLQSSPEDLDRLYAVNVRGPYQLCQLFLPPMIARKGGSIVNLASIGGIIAIRDRAAYCTTKFAVVGLTKSMAIDHAGDQVRINCICPGRVETPFVSARIKEYPDPEKAYRELSSVHPIGRMARPDEIAEAALYLASDASSFVTGSALVIDGGLSAS